MIPIEAFVGAILVDVNKWHHFLGHIDLQNQQVMKNAENNLEEQWRAAGRRCAQLPWNNLVNMKNTSVFVFVFFSVFVFVLD